MPIRVEHQPSPGMVGLAAYAAGAGAGSGGVGSRGRGSKYPILPGLANQGLQNRLALQGQGFDYRSQLADEQELRRQWSTPPALTPIPDYVDPATRKELTQTGSAIRGLHTDFAHNDANARRRDQELRRQYEDKIAGLTPPSNAESIKRDLYYADEKSGNVFDEPGEGRKAYRKSTGKPAFDMTEAKAEQAAAKQARVEAERAFQAEHAQWAQVEGLKQKHIDHLTKETDEVGKQVTSREKAQAAADEKYGANPRPTRPAAGGGGGSGEIPEVGVDPSGRAVVPVAPAQPAGPGAAAPATGQAPGPAVRTLPAAPAPVPVIPAGGDDAIINDEGVMVGTQPAAPATPPTAASPSTGWTPIGTGTLAPTGDEAMTPAQRVQANAAKRAADRRGRSGIVRSGPGGAGGRPAPLARGGMASTVSTPPAEELPPEDPYGLRHPGMADLSKLSSGQVRQVRRLAESPSARLRMEQQFGGHIQTIDEIYPTPPAPESPQSAAMEHLAAIRGPQGTGEGIASDADRMANSIAGVRPAYTRQDTGGTVTKYRLAGESQVAAAQAKLQANESARAKAIRAARAGDVAAQRALEERGIRWQM